MDVLTPSPVGAVGWGCPQGDEKISPGKDFHMKRFPQEALEAPQAMVKGGGAKEDLYLGAVRIP